jgi:hypothetical protein
MMAMMSRLVSAWTHQMPGSVIAMKGLLLTCGVVEADACLI